MNVEIKYERKNETITIKANGWRLRGVFNIKSHHDFISHKIKCGKTLGGLKIVEYYPPEYIGDKKNEQNTNNKRKGK